MGVDWGPKQLKAFLEFLAGVVQLAPSAKITHRFEGSSNDTPGFTEAVVEYIQGKQ